MNIFFSGLFSNLSKIGKNEYNIQKILKNSCFLNDTLEEIRLQDYINIQKSLFNHLKEEENIKYFFSFLKQNS